MQVPEGETRQQRRARERDRDKRTAQTDKQLSKMVGGTVDGKQFHEWPKWDERGLPTRENCDPSNPRQKFLWMFTAPPGIQGAPMAFPTEYWELMSFRQCTLGAGIIAEPTMEWHPPTSNLATNPWTASGEWHPVGTPRKQTKTLRQMIDELPQQERAELRAAVLERMGLDDAGEPISARERPGPPAEQYTVAALAERVSRPIPELLDALASIGLPHLHGGSVVGRDIGLRLVEHMGL